MGSRRKLRRNFGRLLLIGAGTLVLADYGRELIAVDRCLDAGHVYDYHEGSAGRTSPIDPRYPMPSAVRPCSPGRVPW
jgi:hypothetical protein